MEDRLWQVLAKPGFQWRNKSGLSMNAARAAWQMLTGVKTTLQQAPVTTGSADVGKRQRIRSHHQITVILRFHVRNRTWFTLALFRTTLQNSIQHHRYTPVPWQFIYDWSFYEGHHDPHQQWCRSCPAYQDIPPASGVLMLGDISGLETIYIVCVYTDMCKSIDGLCAVI